jgi:hypothetical protein
MTYASRFVVFCAVLGLLGSCTRKPKTITEAEAAAIADVALKEFTTRRSEDPGGFSRTSLRTLTVPAGWQIQYCRVAPSPRFVIVFVGIQGGYETWNKEYCN